MKTLKLSLLATGLICSATSFSQTSAPKDILAKIVGMRNDAAKRRKAGETVNPDELKQQIRDEARAAVVNLDPSRISSAEASDWMQIYEDAEMPKEVVLIGKKSFADNVSKIRVDQENLIRATIESGDFDQLMVELKYLVVSDPTMIGQLGQELQYGLQKYIKIQPEKLLEAYGLLIKRLDPDHPLTPRETTWEPYVFVSLKVAEFEVLYQNGRQQEAINGLKILKQRFANNTTSKNAYGDSVIKPIDAMLDRFAMEPKLAPAIAFDRTIGDFPGLAKLKGQVVVLDFFAHWCGPCKRAFPEIRKFWSDYRGKGLQIVGVTSYYGYYGPQQNLSPKAEYDQMKKFVVDQNLTWPVAFDPTANTSKAYGVSAIPQFVIIDRAGLIRYVEVGYSPEHEEEIRKTIEKCLAAS